MEQKYVIPPAPSASASSGAAAAVVRASVRQSASPLQEHCHNCSEALAAAAHDLKTPLAVLSGYIDLLTAAKFGPLTPRQESVLKEMQGNLARLQHFTDEFLTFYAVQAGVELQLQESDVNQCIADVVKMWAPQFTHKAVAFYWLPGEELIPVTFDYHKVQHIVSNLLDNALKFTPAGGSVWVQTENYFWERRSTQQQYRGKDRRRSSSVHFNCARINVSDTGPGIALDNFQEIFEEFHQVRLDEKKLPGTGLGLAIARKLAKMHHGKIWVESELGQGAKFSFVLPRGSGKRE